MQHQILFLQLSRTVHWVLMSAAPGLWHYFAHRYRQTQLSSGIKRRRLRSCPSLGSHRCFSGRKASVTWNHSSVAAQQTWGLMTWRCSRPAKKLGLPPVHSKGSWDSPVGQYADTKPWHICSSGISSVMCYTNGQPFRNTECWNAPQGKKTAEKIHLASPELSLHTCSSHACNKNTDLCRGTCLWGTICTAQSALTKQYTSLWLFAAMQRAVLRLHWEWRDWTQPA